MPWRRCWGRRTGITNLQSQWKTRCFSLLLKSKQAGIITKIIENTFLSKSGFNVQSPHLMSRSEELCAARWHQTPGSGATLRPARGDRRRFGGSSIGVPAENEAEFRWCGDAIADKVDLQFRTPRVWGGVPNGKHQEVVSWNFLLLGLRGALLNQKYNVQPWCLVDCMYT